MNPTRDFGVLMSERPMNLMFAVRKTAESFPVKRNLAQAMAAWSARLFHHNTVAAEGLLGGGSLSYRYGPGFVITSCDADLARLTDADLVFAERWDFSAGCLWIRGRRDPPVESLLHAAIYQHRSVAIFAVCVHAPQCLKMMSCADIPATEREQPSGSLEQAAEFENKLGSGNLIAVRGLGLISFGCTAEDAGGQVLLRFQSATSVAGVGNRVV